jgi:hypothetical protein
VIPFVASIHQTRHWTHCQPQMILIPGVESGLQHTFEVNGLRVIVVAYCSKKEGMVTPCTYWVAICSVASTTNLNQHRNEESIGVKAGEWLKQVWLGNGHHGWGRGQQPFLCFRGCSPPLSLDLLTFKTPSSMATKRWKCQNFDPETGKRRPDRPHCRNPCLYVRCFAGCDKENDLAVLI